MKICLEDVFWENKFNIFKTYCKEHELIYMSDLKVFDFEKLNTIKGMGKSKINSVVSRYNEWLAGKVVIVKPEKVELSLDELNLEKLLDILREKLDESAETRKFKIFLLRFIGYTLDSVGEVENGLTRERIRQLEKKYYNELGQIMNSIIAKLMVSKGYVTVQQLLDLFDNDNYSMVVIYWCKLCKSLEYLRFADVFVPKQKESVEKKLLALAKDLIGDDLLDLRERSEDIEMALQENGYSYVDIDDFLELLKHNKYRRYGDYIAKGKKPYGYLCAKVVENNFPQGIRLSDNYTQDLNLLRQFVEKEYGEIGIPENTHPAVTGIIRHLVLSGKGEYTVESNVHIPMSLLEEIKEYIDNSPEIKMYYSAIFSKFEGKLRMMSNIDNDHFLHGVLKLYYPDDYIFPQRDYLEKRGDGYKTVSRADKIVSAIRENGKPSNKRDIMKKVHGLTDVVLLNVMNQNEDLFQWDYNMYYLISELNIDDTEKQFLSTQIKEIILANRGCCSDNLLYEKIINVNPEFLKRKNIGNATNLFFVCSKLLGDKFDFRRPHIIEKGLLDDISIRSVAMYFLGNPTMLSYEMFNKLALDLKWANGSKHQTFTAIEKDYIRISLDNYLLKDKFNFSDAKKKEIENVIQKQMSSGYLSLLNFDEWKDELPKIEYEWNVFLFRSIIDHYIENYKIIEPQAKDRRYERGILINSYSALSSYDEFVANFISEQGYTEISAGEMLNQLVINNLAYKMIPKELYLSEKVKYEEKDGKFYIV